MSNYLKIILVTFCFFIASLGSAQAQNLNEITFNLYVRSVFYPEQFGGFIRDNQHIFNQEFLEHLNCVAQRLFGMARAEIELCQQHIDPAWRNQCMQENVAVGLYFWCVSLYAAISGEQQWSNTWTGSTVIYAKQMSEGLGLDWVSTMRIALSVIEQQIRLYFVCI